MTQPSYQVHASASLEVQAHVLRRAEWASERVIGRGDALTPIPDTWYGHKVRGRAAHDFVLVAMIACPKCGGMNILSHSPEAARAISAMTGRAVPPVAQQIDHLGKVSPDFRCMHPGCGFHRKVYLDRWNKTKPLYACAFIDMKLPVKQRKIEIAYSHAIDAREARFHLGPGKFHVIATGPAIGFHVDERTG
jgi:hypothetical protein